MNRIPNDPLNRAWSEVSFDSDEFMRGLRSSLVSFLAFGPDREARDVGSGFIVAGKDDVAVVVTAKHVLDFAASVQRPHPRSAASALFAPTNHPSSEPDKLRAVWFGEGSSNLLDVYLIHYNEVLDLAVCIVAPPAQNPYPFKPASIPIDTRPIQIGDQIVVVSCHITPISEMQPPTDSSGSGQVLQIQNRAAMRTGVVTGLYGQGHRVCRWPCFTSSIPAEPGMSGGFAFFEGDTETVAACGVVCADYSDQEARTNAAIAGESVLADGWTALGLKVPDSVPWRAGDPEFSMREMMVRGAMPMAVGGVDHVQIHEQTASDDYAIEYVAAKAPPGI